MRLYLLPIFFLSFNNLPVAAQNLNQSDGPYVFYRDGKIVVRVINDSTVKTDSFVESEKVNHPLSIHFSNHEDWDFTVAFKKDIQNEPCKSTGANKIIFLSDIEGEFEAFRNLLLANKVIDSKYQWIFGKGQLVICGDLFDRGKDVAAELWLLYKLEEEARAQGGYVHTILGNHDIMNLSGDFRYVQPKYFDHAKMMGNEYGELYGPDTELGRWLRSKNIMEKVGGNLCLHGGVSAIINKKQMSLNDINNQCRPFYDLAQHPEKFTDKSLWDFFGDASPFWYRGYFLEPKAFESQIDSTLSLYQCLKIIIGHTIVDNVSSLYHGKVIGIDVNEHEGNAQGLLIENKQVYKVNLIGKKQLLE